jgi:hypothetical protein
LLFTVALSVLAVVEPAAAPPVFEELAPLRDVAPLVPAVALPLYDVDPLREDVVPSFAAEGLVSREAEPLAFIFEVAPGVDAVELEPLRDVVLLVDSELGESEDDDDVPVLVLMPASEFGAEPLTLPLGLDGAL